MKAFSKEGEYLYDIGNEGSGDGQLNEPLGLAIDKFNNLIVCDAANSNLQAFTLEGKFVSTIRTSLFGRPWSIAVDTCGLLLIFDAGKKCILVLE